MATRTEQLKQNAADWLAIGDAPAPTVTPAAAGADAPGEAPKTRDIVSPDSPRPGTDAEAPAIKVRTSKTTVTTGGLVRRTIYTPAPLWARVMRRALSEGRSAADVVRDALEAYLADGTPAP